MRRDVAKLTNTSGVRETLGERVLSISAGQPPTDLVVTRSRRERPTGVVPGEVARNTGQSVELSAMVEDTGDGLDVAPRGTGPNVDPAVRIRGLALLGDAISRGEAR